MNAPEKNKKARGDFWIFLSLFFLINPSVQVVDVLPDFIAYFIIVNRLSYATERAPYFAEAKNVFSRLLLLSLLKIPAFFVIVFARSGNVGDTDIYALFAFSFAVIEAILSVSAVYYLFEAAFYLGQRTDAICLIRPFYINKKQTRTLSPEALRRLVYTFAIYKCAAYGLPELLLLTKTVTAEELVNYFNITKLYPYTILLAIFSVIIFGFIVLRRVYAYYKNALAEADLKSALNSLISGESKERLESNARIKDIATTLSIVSLASFFVFEIRLDNFSLVNILPHLVMGVMLLFAAHRLEKQVGKCLGVKISLAVFIVISAAEWFLEVGFLSEYSFSLLATSRTARNEFIPIIVVSLIELVAFSTAAAMFGKELVKLQKMHTGKSTSDFSRKNLVATYGFSMLATLSCALRYISLILRYFSKNTLVTIENDGMITQGMVTAPLLPWFSIVVNAVSIIFIFYSYYLFSSIKDKVEIKYS